MTNEELEAKIQGTIRRLTEIEYEVLDVSRRLIPVLKDSGQKHSAEVLELLFLEYDGLTEDARRTTIANLPRIMKLALGIEEKGSNA